MIKFYDAEMVRILAKVGIDADRAVEIHRKLLKIWLRDAQKIYKRRSEHVLEEMLHLDSRYEEAILSIISRETGKDPNKYHQDIESRTFEFNASSRGNASFSEVRSALEHIRKSHPTISLHVASNAHTSHVRGTITGASLNAYFRQILGYDRIGFQKTNPKYWPRLLQLIGSTSVDTVFVGDSAVEVQGCAQLGMVCIIVDRNGTFDPSILGEDSLIIKNLCQLPEALTNLQ